MTRWPTSRKRWRRPSPPSLEQSLSRTPEPTLMPREGALLTVPQTTTTTATATQVDDEAPAVDSDVAPVDVASSNDATVETASFVIPADATVEIPMPKRIVRAVGS